MLDILPLLSLLTLLFASPVFAQNTGQWSMNASIPLSNPATSGCIILAQFTNSTPPVLQALKPICPLTSTVPTNPATGASVHWPLANNAADGDSLASQLLIYGQVEHRAERTDLHMAQAGCVMRLSADQAQYLLGRSLTWNNGLQELWDNTGDGFVLNPEGNARAACGQDITLLPESLWLPDPYIVDAANPIWQSPITITVQTAPEPADESAGTAGNTTYPVVAVQGNATDEGVITLPVIGDTTVADNTTVDNGPTVIDNATGVDTANSTTPDGAVAVIISPSPSPSPSVSISSSSFTSSTSVSSSSLIAANLAAVPSNDIKQVDNNATTSSAVVAIQQGCTGSITTVTVSQISTATLTVTETVTADMRRRMMWP